MLGELNPCGGGDSIPLLHEKLLICRRSSCDICLAVPNVSSHHCELELQDGFWHIRDLGSTNGIKVNGERTLGSVLMPGDNFYKTFPNLYTIRGTAYRDVTQWVDSLDKMRRLHPEHLAPPVLDLARPVPDLFRSVPGQARPSPWPDLALATPTPKPASRGPHPWQHFATPRIMLPSKEHGGHDVCQNLLAEHARGKTCHEAHRSCSKLGSYS